MSREYTESVSSTSGGNRFSLLRGTNGGEELKYCSAISGEFEMLTKGARVSEDGSGLGGGVGECTTWTSRLGDAGFFPCAHVRISNKFEARLGGKEMVDALFMKRRRENFVEGLELSLLSSDEDSLFDWDRSSGPGEGSGSEMVGLGCNVLRLVICTGCGPSRVC